MNYKKVLTRLGLVEGVDFSLTLDSFEMLPKTQIVEVSPAVLDEEGNVITEAVMEEQEYTPEPPTEAQLEAANKEVVLDESDIVLLINEYLSDKQHLKDVDNDCINIVNGRIYEWSYVNIPQPSIDQLVALAPIVASKQQAESSKQAKLQAGKKAREACLKCLDLIAGYNLEQELTAEQITEMQQNFAPIQTALMTSRPSTAKALISALVPDGILVSEELKQLVLNELQEY